MPRTSLFATLLRLVRIHKEAARRGVSPEQVLAEAKAAPPTPRGISRRGFLGAAGAAAATLAIPRRAHAAADVNPRVVIVGAGISGLSAALTLNDMKLTDHLQIYESSNRIGGRMFSNSSAVNGTAYWDDDQVTEWCGELVDTDHATIMQLCTRYNLPLADLPSTAPAGSTAVSYFGGQYYTQDQMNTDFAAVYTQIQNDVNVAYTANDDDTVLYNTITPQGIALDNMSVTDWIAAKVPGGMSSNMGKLIDAAYASEFGADSSEQSSLNLVLLLSGTGDPTMANDFVPFGSSDEKYHIIGGNQQLPLAIAADLQAQLGAGVIQMNSKLTKIAVNSDGTIGMTFAVTAAGATTNQEVTADAVILTCPFAVMADDVDFTGAGFDARKTQAIMELGRGYCSKLQLQFTSRLWNTAGAWGTNNGEETFSDNGDQCSWHVTRGQAGVSGILNGYTGGTPTTDRAAIANTNFGKINMGSAGAGIATLATTFLTQLEQIFPGVTALFNGKATLSIPHLDPNFKLSYSYWKKGQYQAFAGYERVPQGNIFFGGEHTSVDFQGFMEGGASEGVRAATEVVTAAMAGTLVRGKGGCGCHVGGDAKETALPIAAVAAGGLALAALRGRPGGSDDGDGK
jgi:monoamine oxidase